MPRLLHAPNDRESSDAKRPYFLLNFIGAFQIKERRQNGPQSATLSF